MWVTVLTFKRTLQWLPLLVRRLASPPRMIRPFVLLAVPLYTHPCLSSRRTQTGDISIALETNACGNMFKLFVGEPWSSREKLRIAPAVGFARSDPI